VREIDLKTLHGCLEELESCSRGLAYFDHLYAICLDKLNEAEATMEAVRSEAAAAAREDAPKAATAVEINGRITHWINERPSASKARSTLREVETQKAKLDRWLRSLEKRLSAAQSARSGHESLARGGGV